MRRRIAAILIAATAILGLGAPAHAATGGPTPAATSLTAQVGPSIVGGHPAPLYHWIASLQVNAHGDPDWHRCTALEVADDTIGINAHCVTNADGSAMDPALFHLRMDTIDRRDGGVLLHIDKITVVPGWNWGFLDAAGRVDDLALLHLTTYVPEQPLEIATAAPSVGQAVREIGWGRTDAANLGPAPQFLQELDTKIDPASACATAPADVDNGIIPIAVGEICADNPNGTDAACGGDSGGPLPEMLPDGRWHNTGGASRSEGMVVGCGGEPMIYTSYAYFRPWIFAVMRGETAQAAMKYLPVTAHHGPGPQQVADLSPAQQQARARWQAQWALAG